MQTQTALKESQMTDLSPSSMPVTLYPCIYFLITAVAHYWYPLLVSSLVLHLFFCESNTIKVQLSLTQPEGQGTARLPWQSEPAHFLMTPPPQTDSRWEIIGREKPAEGKHL